MEANWLVGNSVETEQWESGNSSVAFPFEDDSLPEGFPRDVIVDACVVVASPGEPSYERVTVGSVHIGETMASVFIMVGGEPALYCNVLKDRYEPFSPVRMTSVMPGVSGVVAFGNVDFGARRTYRLDIPLSESAVVRPVVGRLEKFVREDSGTEASGVVSLDLPSGISMSIDEDGHSSRISFSSDASIRGKVPAPCSQDGPSTMTVPVRRINGIEPDDSGRIAIVFMHDESELEGIDDL